MRSNIVKGNHIGSVFNLHFFSLDIFFTAAKIYLPCLQYSCESSFIPPSYNIFAYKNITYAILDFFVNFIYFYNKQEFFNYLNKILYTIIFDLIQFCSKLILKNVGVKRVYSQNGYIITWILHHIYVF